MKEKIGTNIRIRKVTSWVRKMPTILYIFIFSSQYQTSIIKNKILCCSRKQHGRNQSKKSLLYVPKEATLCFPRTRIQGPAPLRTIQIALRKIVQYCLPQEKNEPHQNKIVARHQIKIAENGHEQAAMFTEWRSIAEEEKFERPQSADLTRREIKIKIAIPLSIKGAAETQ